MNHGKLSKEYDRIYEEADALFKRYDPCQFKDGKCKSEVFPDGCCEGCVYLGSNGCTIQSLGCKLFMCGSVIKHKELYSGIRALTIEAGRKLLATNCRINKEQSLKMSERWLR